MPTLWTLSLERSTKNSYDHLSRNVPNWFETTHTHTTCWDRIAPTRLQPISHRTTPLGRLRFHHCHSVNHPSAYLLLQFAVLFMVHEPEKTRTNKQCTCLSLSLSLVCQPSYHLYLLTPGQNKKERTKETQNPGSAVVFVVLEKEEKVLALRYHDFLPCLRYCS